MTTKAKLSITYLFQCLVCFLQFKSLYSETVLGEETGEFNLFGRPRARHQFEVQVGAGREECFYQKLRKDATLEVSYKVLRGDNRKVNVFLKNPNQTIMDSIKDKPDGNIDRVVTETGVYSICIDNTLRPFSSKLVYLYLGTYVESEWDKYSKELDDIHVAVSNFATSINSVENSINEVLKHQAHTKMIWAWDYYWAYRNSNYVQYWAILHCAIFFVTSVFQVYFVRRLFRYVNVTPTAKPRA
ncbi:hypothetical protein CHS0354_001751 [Potamilus streckersoni]|uniref:GOLD domain-containing protein n=1 Tax=Potamilus streckersoni TaxID=2493646 RepID=A0AAE0SJF8_9BIVA|nr:hypothetical protein CHS0354_001751 [Potamilus streckersoni]